MNKQKIDTWIPKAYQALEYCKIAENGTIDKGYRGQIAAFGASVAMGGLLSAIGFFTAQGNSEVERQKLMQAILALIAPDRKETLFKYALTRRADPGFKDDVLCAAVALKLAMNLYELVEKKPKQQREAGA